MIAKIKSSLKNIANLALVRKKYSLSKLDIRTFEEIQDIAVQQLQEIEQQEKAQRREQLSNEQDVQPARHTEKQKTARSNSKRKKPVSKSNKANTSGAPRRKS